MTLGKSVRLSETIFQTATCEATKSRVSKRAGRRQERRMDLNTAEREKLPHLVRGYVKASYKTSNPVSQRAKDPSRHLPKAQRMASAHMQEAPCNSSPGKGDPKAQGGTTPHPPGRQGQRGWWEREPQRPLLPRGRCPCWGTVPVLQKGSTVTT